MDDSQVKKDVHQANGDGDGSAFVSPAFHPLVVGDEGNEEPSAEQVSAIVSILLNAAVALFRSLPFSIMGRAVCPMYVVSFLLVYHLLTQIPLQDRILCVPDEQHKLAVELFTTQSDILKPWGPLPLKRPDLLNHKYPRFKAIGRTDFWLLLPASYCHIVCEPNNVEWSQG